MGFKLTDEEKLVDKGMTPRISMQELKDKVKPDPRYNNPKEAPQVDEKLVDKTIEETEIYYRAKQLILNAQRKQVGYGLEKYPNPLNANTWDILETIDHAIDESVDKLHYLVMLRIHLERLIEKEKELDEKRNNELDVLLSKLMTAGKDLDGDMVNMLICKNSRKS